MQQPDIETTRKRCAETAELGQSSFEWVRDPKNVDTVKLAARSAVASSAAMWSRAARWRPR